MIAKHFAKNTKYFFGSQALNIRISERDPITNERIDKNLDRYGHLFRAFVLKRRMNRAEIWPKIHIIDEVPVEQEAHLNYQKLFSMKKSMRDDMMVTISKNDPSKINSAFIISNFCQDHFKQMMDQYVGKVLVCGKAPKDQKQYLVVQSKVKQLYRIFYFGEKRSYLEREIEQSYLSSKQLKYLKSQKQKQINKDGYEACKWTEKDQRVLQQKQNWLPLDTSTSDLNYRNFFQPLQFSGRGEARLKFQKLYTNFTFFDQLKYQWYTSKYYNPKSSKYYEWIEQQIFVRIMNHLKSTQFTSCLNIPHDYMIEAQLAQIHFWLVINRLKQIGTTGCNVLARRLTMSLNLEVSKSARSVNLKKSNVLQASLERMLETNNTILQLHFNRSDITKQNPYKGIDAMVWSIAFAEKVHRYSEEVYLFSEYLIKNFQNMKHHTEWHMLNGILQFDPYLVQPKYREKIEKINPPLSAVQFEKQFNSNSLKKDYYYSKVQAEMDESMPIQKQYQPSKVDTSFSFDQFLQPLRNMRIKYLSLRTMDHFNKMEEKKKENEQIEKKGTWKSQIDEVKQVNQQFKSFQTIKNQRKRKSSQQQ